MPLYVFDTDVLTLFREGHQTVCQHVSAHPPTELATTVITVEEQLSGWYKLLRQARRPDQLELAYQQLAQTVQFFTGIQILTFSLAAISRYQQLQTLKLNVGKMDLRIAAIALEAQAVVVTRNTRDFQRVPHLVMADWTV